MSISFLEESTFISECESVMRLWGIHAIVGVATSECVRTPASVVRRVCCSAGPNAVCCPARLGEGGMANKSKHHGM